MPNPFTSNAFLHHYPPIGLCNRLASADAHATTGSRLTISMPTDRASGAVTFPTNFKFFLPFSCDVFHHITLYVTYQSRSIVRRVKRLVNRHEINYTQNPWLSGSGNKPKDDEMWIDLFAFNSCQRRETVSNDASINIYIGKLKWNFTKYIYSAYYTYMFFFKNVIYVY